MEARQTHHAREFYQVTSIEHVDAKLIYTPPDLDVPRLEKRIPLQRIGKPEEIADAALFLAKNQYAHNCVINIDGGLSAM